MNYHFSAVSLSMLVSAGLTFSMACYAFAHRRTRGARELTLCMLIATLWSVSNAMEYSIADLTALLFWTNVQYFVYAFAPFFWFAMIFRFNGKEDYLTPRNLILLSVIPSITTVLVWLDPVFGLVRHSFSVEYSGGIPYLGKTFGPWFWVHFVYSYGFNLADLLFLFAAVGKKGSLFRRQSIYILVCLGLAFVTNLAYILGFTPVAGIDLTSVTFGFSALFIWWGIFRHGIFRIAPIARTKIFESMANGILVVDDDWNLIDSNKSAREMFGLESERVVGRNLRASLPPLSAVTEKKLPAETSPVGRESFRWEFSIKRPTGERFYKLTASRLQRDHYSAAWAILAADVTDLKRAQEEIIRQRAELAMAAQRDHLYLELHNTLGQVLSFAVVQMETVPREIERGNMERATSYLERLRDILKDTHEYLRGFVRDIRATEYASLDFVDILEREAERIRQRCKIAVTVAATAGSVDFTPFLKTHLAVILKEALDNIAKHARATRIDIHFRREGGILALFIDDDGIGPEAGGGSLRAGSGLALMRERAASFGGTLEAGGKSDGGTRVAVRFPAV